MLKAHFNTCFQRECFSELQALRDRIFSAGPSSAGIVFALFLLPYHGHAATVRKPFPHDGYHFNGDRYSMAIGQTFQWLSASFKPQF